MAPKRKIAKVEKKKPKEIKKSKEFTVEEAVAIADEVKAGATHAHVAGKYGTTRRSVSYIVKTAKSGK